MLDELALIDKEFQFESDWFAPLHAEVEVRTRMGVDEHRIANLLETIESDKKTPIFLVFGDPGAGKSVALRELARQGLRAASHTGVLPIYINLREWLPEAKWSTANPPTVKSLKKFLRSYLSELGRSDLSDFFGEYLGRLHLDGRVFWIFNSFDEIPAVLDAGKAQPIVEALSAVIANSSARGVLVA